MDTDTNKNLHIGQRCRLIVRQLNGTNSIYTGVLIAENDASYTIKTDRGEERTEPKLYAAVEWLGGRLQ